MTTQTILPCKFEQGHCVHCGDSEQTCAMWEKCEGWLEPEFLAAVRVLKAEVETLTNQMQAYGKACRDAALEEAATRCERVIDTEKVCGIEVSRLLNTADLIRSLK